MTSTDIALFVGEIITSWTFGFTGGYLITKFRDAINATI